MNDIYKIISQLQYSVIPVDSELKNIKENREVQNNENLTKLVDYNSEITEYNKQLVDLNKSILTKINSVNTSLDFILKSIKENTQITKEDDI